MSLDPDYVRVDLLKVKRKLFISYPEGSKERQVFITAAKVSELAYLQQLLPLETTEFIFEEYATHKHNQLKGIVICLGIGTFLSGTLFALHHMYPTSLWFNTFYVPLIFGLILSVVHAYYLVEAYRRFVPFKKEYDLIQEKRKKIVDELKGLYP